jgi:lipoprotein-releasing system permease protein
MIGVIGTAIGLVFAFLACLVLDAYRVDLPGDIYFIQTLPVEMSTNDFIVTACAAIIISFLATIYPARRATQLTTIEALRNE